MRIEQSLVDSRAEILQGVIDEILDSVDVGGQMEVTIRIALLDDLLLGRLNAYAEFLGVVAEIVLRDELEFVLLNFLIIAGIV